jgi:hypothetical protein
MPIAKCISALVVFFHFTPSSLLPRTLLTISAKNKTLLQTYKPQKAIQRLFKLLVGQQKKIIVNP